MCACEKNIYKKRQKERSRTKEEDAEGGAVVSLLVADADGREQIKGVLGIYPTPPPPTTPPPPPRPELGTIGQFPLIRVNPKLGGVAKLFLPV